MTLLDEIRNGENATLEFKEARPKDSLKFTKTVVAFANGRGGRILFGVEDKTGRLVGIPRDKVAAEMDAIADTVANTCTPPLSIDIKPTTIDGKVLIALDVRSGDKTPYYVKSLGIRKGTFIRIGAISRNVEEHKLKSLILAGENLSFDMQPVKSGRVTKKDVESLCRVMTETAKKNCRTEEERKSVKAMTEKRLVSMGLLLRKSGKTIPAYGYYIVSGEPMPGIMQPKIKCGVFRGVQKGDFVDRRTCEGSAVSQIEDAYAFLLRNIRIGSEIVGTQRRDVYELPLDSIREAICNAVFHRDYLEPSSIYVALYDDRLEILSPGGLVKDFSLEDAMNGFSKLRNNALGDALEYMKEVEAWGGGVSRYFTACATAGLPPPIVSEEAGCFKVVFWRQAIANVKTGANESNIGHPNGNIESVKGNIDLQKGNIELPEGDIAVADGNIAMGQNMNVKFSSATLDKIAVLRKSYSGLSFFKRVDALKALKMNPASLSKLFRKMLANGIIEPVSGHGKGAYRFASAGGICTDGCRREGGLDV